MDKLYNGYTVKGGIKPLVPSGGSSAVKANIKENNMNDKPEILAFPVMHSIDGNWVKDPLPQYCGMPLRDWFAGKALQGIIASPRMFVDKSTGKECSSITDIANQSYNLANAMMKAREL